MSIRIELPDELAETLRLQAAERGVDLNHYAVTTLQAAAERLEKARLFLEGPARPLAESFTELRRKHNLPDLSLLPADELDRRAEEALAAADPERMAEAERLGLI